MRIRRGGIAFLGDEFHFADQCAAPRVVDAIAKIAGHVLELPLPGFGIGGDFKTAFFAAEGMSVGGEGLSYDLRPRTGQPGEGGFRMFELARDASEEIASFVHGNLIVN